MSTRHQQSPEEESFELTVPGGWGAKIKGFGTDQVLMGFLMLVCLGFFMYTVMVGRALDVEARDLNMQQHLQTQKTITELAKIQKETQAQLEELTFILTLDPKKREALRLEMPSTLRRKLYDRDSR